MTAERQALTEAHAAVAKARADLEGSRSASASARAFLEEVSRAAEALREVDRDISAARARELKEALKSRSTPRFQSAPQVLENAAARADAESQVTAAAQAAAELADEEAQAEKALEAAQDNLAAAVKAVLFSEARALASRIDAKASELVALRAQLGGVHSFVGQLEGLTRSPMGATIARVLQENDRSEVGTRNSKAWHLAQRAQDAWIVFASALASDSTAALNFDLDAAE